MKSRDDERLIVYLGGSPDPELRAVPGGIELRIDASRVFALAHYRTLRSVAGIELREDGGKSIALIRLTCDCDAKPGHSGSIFTLDLRAKDAAAKSADQHPKAAPPGKAATAGGKGAGSHAASELEGLRDALAARLASLNAPPAGAQPAAAAASANPPGPGAAATQDAASTPPRPACPPSFDMATWKGDAGFADRLVQLRARAAEAHEAAPAMATLAEFYLGNGLAAEALSAVQQAQIAEGQDADRLRLARIADVAHLLRREPIAVASPLLAEPADCARADLPLWRALEAAAAHDAKAVAREAEAAQGVLRNVPEPLLQLFAFAIAEAADDNLGVLRAMASAVRNTAIGGPEEEAARFLVQARIARAEGDAADAAAFLTRAAAHDRTLPGATAKVELAALQAMRDGPDAAPAEMVLADAARVYRSDSLGQTAATYLAEQRLRHGDYAAALAVADASAGPVATRRTDSRGAALAARILRKLLVEPAAGAAAAPGSAAPAAGPSPAERLALYWRYEGYATPGVQGDDIRLGAARIMLAEDLPAPALELLETVAASPEAMLLRATAEARAGDPAAALVMVQAMPQGDEVHRIAADALSRMGRPGDAAQQLEGMAGVADRVRRTSLLAAATDWPATEAACDALLHDPALAGAARRQVADRYSLALALDGGKADPAVTAEPGSLAAGVLAALPDAGSDAAADAGSDAANDPAADRYDALGRMRSALAHARQIEMLLPSTETKRGS